MNKLNIEALGLQEMTKEEMREIEGGNKPHEHHHIPVGNGSCYCTTHHTEVKCNQKH